MRTRLSGRNLKNCRILFRKTEKAEIPAGIGFRGILFTLFLALAGVSGYAQIPPASPWWYTMEQGKSLFRSGDYGRALLSFEDARRQRQSMYAAMEQDLINFLSVSEVRRLGDSLSVLETHIAARGYESAAAALRELYYRVPKVCLNDSAGQALTELSRLQYYP
jgi:hypothetical protein